MTAINFRTENMLDFQTKVSCREQIAYDEIHVDFSILGQDKNASFWFRIVIKKKK